MRTAALAAGLELSASALVGRASLRSSLDDDIAEDLVAAFELADGERTLWLAFTPTAMRNLTVRVPAAIAAAAAVLGVRDPQCHERDLDARAAAIARAGARVITVTIDVKLAQLMATTLAVVDVVEPAP